MLFNKVSSLLKMEMKRERDEDFSAEERQLIAKIAVDCRKSKLYKRTNESMPREKIEQWYGYNAGYVFEQMIAKMADAPFPFLAKAAVILLMPIVDDLLNGITTPPEFGKGGY